MRVSQYLLATHKETPADAEVISHQLMLRAGMIRRLGAGLYTWLPLGLKVLQKIENIVREEMNKSGAIEVLMPAVQPAELWQESERWDTFGDQLLKMKDHGEREYCFGPTHEEVITDLARRELKSYKQLPLNIYQIQTKFRDEIRPRFGVMRAREFIMKDAYSFNINAESLEQTYQVMHRTYCNIFNRIGLKYRAVEADTGSIGGNRSHEFQVLADSGEDQIFYSDSSDYAANVEKATALVTEAEESACGEVMQLIDTPDLKTIDEVSHFLNISAKKTIKTLIVHGIEDSLVCLVLRGDHQLNEIKAEKHPLVHAPLTFASDEAIEKACGSAPGFIGPIDLAMTTIVDHSATNLVDFVCGANQIDKHYINANWDNGAHFDEAFDLRNVIVGDLSPDGKGRLQSCRGIEVGHIFQLGSKYSELMGAKVLNEQGKASTLMMGCYGLGVSRVVAAAIEQNHDDSGIIWPDAIAPFKIALLAMNMYKSDLVRDSSEKLYQDLLKRGYEVLFDDRNERAGVMFADCDLIGIPHRIVVGEKSLKEGCVEYKARGSNEKHSIKLDELWDFLAKQC